MFQTFLSRCLFAPALIAVLGLTAVLVLPALAAPGLRIRPRTQVLDFQRRLDANQLDLFVTNFGAIGYDLAQGNPGLIFPRLTGRSVLFASGLWVGGKVGGEVRVSVSEYSSEWAPGAASGGVREDATAPDQIVYKTKAFMGDPGDIEFAAGSGLGIPPADAVAHHAWSTYVAGAAPHGAPTRSHRLPDTSTPDPSDSLDVLGPDLPGDLATWSVYNDLDPVRHTNPAGSTAPLGLEVKQTVYGFSPVPGDPDGTLQNAALMRFQIRNAGPNPIDSTYFGYWSDPDIGGAGDDLSGWDGDYGFAYTYNATNNDFIYGSAPPALGVALLEGPVLPSLEQPYGVASATRFIGGIDPNSALESYFALRGFVNGTPWVDPQTLAPSRYPLNGDPVSNTGWLDSSPADRRAMMSVGPVTLAPGQEVTLTFALLVAQGTSRLDSIRRLRCVAAAVRASHARGFSRPFEPLSPACQGIEALACPWTPENWANECAATAHMTPQVFDALANDLRSSARSFQPGFSPPREMLCGGLVSTATARQRAEREFYALLANRVAQQRQILLENGSMIGLPMEAAVSCPGVNATTMSQLLQRCPDGELTATYVKVDDEPRDLQPTNFALEAYDGGVGFGSGFFGSSLDYSTQPDSFRTVELRFGPGQVQKGYRYLRLENPSRLAPPQGRGYLYGGFVDVPFRCVDVATDQTLDVAFVEILRTDFDGTILPSDQQAATFDSTWSPDHSADGGREYLFVTNLPAQGVPRPVFEQDGYITSESTPPPLTYAATLRSFEAGDTPEAGELLRIEPGPPPSPGVDRALVVLERAPQDDPATARAYEDIVACLAPINRGLLSPSKCLNYVPVLATLVEANASAGGVALAWFVADRSAGPFALERRDDDGDGAWRALATVAPDGSGYVRYADHAVSAGAHLSYRLVERRIGGEVAQGEVSVVVPGAAAVGALAVAVRFAPGKDLALELALPVEDEVTYDLISLAGRRLAGGSLGRLAAGVRSVRVAPASRFPAGVYLVRVRQAGAEARAKAVFLQ